MAREAASPAVGATLRNPPQAAPSSGLPPAPPAVLPPAIPALPTPDLSPPLASARPATPPDPADHELFLRLLLGAERDLRSFIGSLMRDRHAREDVFQEAALVLWREFARYDRARPFGAWARGVAGKVVLRRWRQDGRAPVPLSPEAVQAVADAFDRLDRFDRRAPAGAVGTVGGAAGAAAGVATGVAATGALADAGQPGTKGPRAKGESVSGVLGGGAPDTDEGDALEHCLQRLPDKSRTLLVMRYVDALKLQEIAARMGGKLEAVHKAITRLRLRLLECIEDRLGRGVAG